MTCAMWRVALTPHRRRGHSLPIVLRTLFWLFICCGAVNSVTAQNPAPSQVFHAHDESAIASFEENPVTIRRMTDAVVLAATGQQSAAAAWQSLVKPGDRVGIKISAVGGRIFSTHKNVVAALVAGLAQAGVPARNVTIWDRADMRFFQSAFPGCAVRAVEPRTGYDPKAVVASPIEGRLIWGDALFVRRSLWSDADEREQLSNESHWSRVIGEVTKIINVPVLSGSESCGVAGCFYNLTIPNLDNWRRFLQRPGASDPYLCDLYRDPRAGPKVVLDIMDGLVAQYAGGPEWQPSYAWSHGTIYASKDPVALDATALRLIESWRAQAKLPSVAASASYLQTAESMEMGNFSPERIEMKAVSVR